MQAKFPFVSLLLLPLLLTPALGGCTSTSENGSTTSTNVVETHINGNLHLDFDDGVLVMKADGHPDARVSANGDLQIGAQQVAVNAGQRVLLKHLYATGSEVRNDGIAIGKAGAAMGVSAVSNVVESLFSNDHKQSDGDMAANSKKVSDAALRMCNDITNLQTTQNELATQLPAVAPYAAFRGETRCDKSVAQTGDNANAAPPRAQ